DQAGDLVIPALVGDPEGVVLGQRRQVFGQLVGAGHGYRPDQHGVTSTSGRRRAAAIFWRRTSLGSSSRRLRFSSLGLILSMSRKIWVGPKWLLSLSRNRPV